MKINTPIIIILILLLTGCNILNKPAATAPAFNHESLQNLVLKAVSGDTGANEKLNYLVDLNIPVNNDYNNLYIDSLITKKQKKFYIVLLNYPNPIYNRLAVYDTALNNYLIDKSLNGYLGESVLAINDKWLVKISEGFLSKEVLQVKRISLYEINDSAADLCFRTFTKLVVPPAVYTQKISEFSEDRITTELSGPKKSPLAGMKDVFVINRARNKYASTDKVFDSFVIDQIKNYKDIFDKPEITDKKSFYESVGIDIGIDTIKNTGNTRNSEGYNLTLTDNWKTLKDISISDNLKKTLKGTKYINDIIGANISVIQIPEGDSAEDLTDNKLVNSAAGKYQLKYSEKIISRNDFIQFFEFSCGAKKYLLILTASRYTYDQYKNDFNDIISSFTINC